MIGRSFWDISPLFEKKPPRPRRKVRCPICGSEKIYLKHVYVFIRKPGEYRVDIVCKCDGCALVGKPDCWSGTISFGVHLSEKEYRKLVELWGKNMITYEDFGHVNINDLAVGGE